MDGLVKIFHENQSLLKAAQFLREQSVSWRCILMLCKLSSKSIDLSLYRMTDKEFDLAIREHNFDFPLLEDGFSCKVSGRLLLDCDCPELIQDIVKQIKASDFEYSDFKITFGQSIILQMNKRMIIKDLEEHLKEDFVGLESQKSTYTIDYKEVFKWIVSPILAQ